MTCTCRKVPDMPNSGKLWGKGMDYDTMRKIRSANLNPALATHFKEPLMIHKGHMQYLFDHKGKRYLDLFGGIVTVSAGHCHPKIREALEDQMKKLWHTSNIYMNPKIHEYAEKLTSKFPSHLNNVYFVNSGSEANDMAILMARLHTKNNDIISLRNSYHGMSLGTMPLTAHGNWKYNAINCFGYHHAANADTYTGHIGGYRDSPVQSCRATESTLVNGICSSTDYYMKELKDVIDYSIPTGKVAGFFAEMIQGVGGVTQFPLGYLKKAYELVRENGGVCIADEVQTGFGRTGDHYWGFESHGASPDIVTLAKGIGNGFPLAAVVTTSEIAKTMSAALHFNTYGGNPLASTVGIAVLDAIEEDELQKNCKIVGTKFLLGLKEFREKFEMVGDVRGKGLMIGVEMVESKATRKPIDTKLFQNIWETCREHGVILGKGGRYGNVFRIKPPMCITEEDVDYALSVFGDALKKTFGN